MPQEPTRKPSVESKPLEGMDALLEGIKWNLGGRKGPGPKDKGYRGSPSIGDSLRKLIMPEKEVPPDPFDKEANALETSIGPSDLIPEYVTRKTGSALAGFAAGFISPISLGKNLSNTMGIIKKKGGNWAEDRIFNDYGDYDLPDEPQGPPLSFEAENALHKFEQKQLKSFVKNKVGTEEDSIRLMLDKGENPFLSTTAIDRLRDPTYVDEYLARDLDRININESLAKDTLAARRKAAGVPITPLGKTESARAYELLIDIELAQKSAGDMVKNGFYPEFSKIKDTDLVNYFKEGFPFRTEIKEVLEYGFRTGDIKLEDVLSGKTTVDTVLKYGVKTNKKLAKAGAHIMKYSLDDAKEVPFKTKDYHVKELKRPGEFAKESDQMSNSVRGYEPGPGDPEYIEGITKGGHSYYGELAGGWSDIKEGRTRVFSLRKNSDKNSVITIEAIRGSDGKYKIVQTRGYQNRNLTAEEDKLIEEFANKSGMEFRESTQDPWDGAGWGGAPLNWNRAERARLLEEIRAQEALIPIDPNEIPF